MNIFIIHGAYGNPDENWIPYMRHNLEKLGVKVIVPKFPTPENQSLKNWIKIISPFMKDINSETIFIGHSLAPVFILSILEKLKIKIRACFFVAGFLDKLGNDTFDNINKTFTTKNFDWEKIQNNCKEFYVYNSDNDPYVPLEKGRDLAEKLNTKLIIISDAGHFNESAGYLKFERLLKDVKSLS